MLTKTSKWNNIIKAWKWRIWKKKRRSKKVRLLCMRADEMFKIHPSTDWSRSCDNCRSPVGIYPSGQSIIERFGRDNVVIHCNHCGSPDGAMLAPGALLEPNETQTNPKFFKK